MDSIHASTLADFLHFVAGFPTRAWIAGGIGLFTAVCLFKCFFDDWSDFLSCIVDFFEPEWLSYFRGDWSEQNRNSFKFTVWVALSIGACVLVYTQLPHFFPRFA